MALKITSKIKLNNGIEMPLFGLGMYRAHSGAETANNVAYALKNVNYRMLDSAQFYRNEEDVGNGIRASGLNRGDIFVVTKLFTTAGGKNQAIETVESSLEKMKIGYIDQYLLHAPQGGHVLECYDVLLDYQRRGLIKTVGVSNFGVAHLEAIKNSGRPLPQVNQIELHPWCTNDDIVKWCRNNNVAVVGYSPLAKANKLNEPIVVELAKKYNKTAAQILIRWSLQKGFVTIPMSSKPNRIEENANVFDFNLSDEDMNRLNEFGKHGKEITGWDPTHNDIAREFGPTS